MSPKYTDERQITLDFEQQVEDYLDYARAIAEHAHTVKREPDPHGVETEAELYVELGAACVKAIRDSGMNREQVLDRINAMFGRTEMASKGELPHKKVKSIHMFNNYLSKPQETPMPIWVLYGICAVTGSFGPLEAIAAGCGAKIISAGEQADLILGKLDQHIREGASLKKQLQRALRRK